MEIVVYEKPMATSPATAPKATAPSLNTNQYPVLPTVDAQISDPTPAVIPGPYTYSSVLAGGVALDTSETANSTLAAPVRVEQPLMVALSSPQPLPSIITTTPLRAQNTRQATPERNVQYVSSPGDHQQSTPYYSYHTPAGNNIQQNPSNYFTTPRTSRNHFPVHMGTSPIPHVFQPQNFASPAINQIFSPQALPYNVNPVLYPGATPIAAYTPGITNAAQILLGFKQPVMYQQQPQHFPMGLPHMNNQQIIM